jgi:GxxExxY protein
MHSNGRFPFRSSARVRADIVVAHEIILEIKSVAAILPVHKAQLLTYVRMSVLRIGLILNFNVRRLTEGIRCYVV